MSSSLRTVLAPRLVAAHVTALVLVAIAVALGFWQLSAWSAQRAAEAVDLTQEAPQPLTDVLSPDEGFPVDALGRPVDVTGAWVPDGSLVVTGRSTDTEEPGDGVWAVTPVAVDGADGAQLLVVRGWAPSADELGDPPTGDVELLARLQPSQPDEPTEPGADTPGDRELPRLRVPDAVQLTDADLYGGYAVVDEPEPGLAEVEVPPVADVGPFTAIQNLLYAIEWWIFGAFAGFVWWRYVRDVLEAARAEEAGTEEDTTPARVGSDA